jgi:SAM-dependent methyltransferase
VKLARWIKRRLRGVAPSGPEWYRAAVGGHWDEIGALQFAFLQRRGLRPDHYMLDVGCGALRGGLHFIRYLETGHYYGVDHEQSLLDAGRDVELANAGLAHKQPHLVRSDDFTLPGIGNDVRFDFALAQSVFTHLTPDMIELCLRRIVARLAPGGTFFATFQESADGTIDPGKPHRWRDNERRGTHYPFLLFQNLAGKVGATVEYLGDWSHPRQQMMMAFRTAPAPPAD